MGTNQDAIQRAVISFLAMMLALLNGTLDALVCMTIHSFSSSISFVMALAYPNAQKTYHPNQADD